MTAGALPRTVTAVLRVVFDNSLLLLFGAVTALVWANLHLGSYERFAHAFHFAVNDVGMVFFFAPFRRTRNSSTSCICVQTE